MIEIVSFPGADRSVTGDILKELHLTEGRNTVASGEMVRLHSSFFRAKKLFMILFCLSTKKKDLCKMNLQTETSFDVSCWQCLEYIGCSNKNCKVVYESAI